MCDKYYIVTWASEGNSVKMDDIVITAKSLSEAQDKFLVWLKDQPVYPHMWRLTFNVREGIYVR